MQTINGSIFAGFKLCDPAIKKVSRGPCNQRGTWRKPEAMQVKMPTPTYRSVVIYHNRAWDTRPVGLLFHFVTSKKTSKFSLNEGVAYWRDALQR